MRNLWFISEQDQASKGMDFYEKNKGEDILYLARILKIVDVYDALTHQRCYRPEIYTPEQALRIMQTMCLQFDPEIHQKFNEYINGTEVLNIERSKSKCLKAR